MDIAVREKDEAEIALKAAIGYEEEQNWIEACKYYSVALSRIHRAMCLNISDQIRCGLSGWFDDILRRMNWLRQTFLGEEEILAHEISDIRSTLSRTSKRTLRESSIRYPTVNIQIVGDNYTPIETEITPTSPETSSKTKKRHHRHRSDRRTLSDFIVKIEDYERKRRLGSGSYGSVYYACHKVTGQEVAIKELNTTLGSPDEQVCFLREVESLARASHPSILKLCGFVLRVSNDNLSPAIVTCYLPNGSLEDVLQGKRKIDATHKMIIFYGVAQGMSYLHKKCDIAHRDLKPGNVILNENLEPVVCDFGLSKVMTHEKMRQSAVCGSPIYMAPELLQQKDYTKKVDVYSYALMMYEILTEQIAFADIDSQIQLTKTVCSGERPQIPDSMPENYAEFISKAWDNDVDKRPSFSRIVKKFESGGLNLPGADLEKFKMYMAKFV